MITSIIVIKIIDMVITVFITISIVLVSLSLFLDVTPFTHFLSYC